MINLYQDIQSCLARKQDQDFFGRIWSVDQEVYTNRLKAIDFAGLSKVLDAGCGFGQWSLALAGLNETVEAVDISEERIWAAKRIADKAGYTNLTFQTGSIEKLPFQNEQFDAVFSYGVIFLTDFKKTLQEFYRVLKPHGKLYFCANGLGWYIYNLIDQHNPSEGFSPRQMAIDALDNTLRYFLTGSHEPGKSIVMPQSLTGETLGLIGFKDIRLQSEGTIQLDPSDVSIKPFYPDPKKYGLENVYEVLCIKD